MGPPTGFRLRGVTEKNHLGPVRNNMGFRGAGVPDHAKINDLRPRLTPRCRENGAGLITIARSFHNCIMTEHHFRR
jgi:hypothetical protein